LEEIKKQDLFIRTDRKEDLRAGIDKARQILLSGGLVAFPTESFYGLAVNATDEEAILRLFAVKKRRSDHPVLILIPSLEALGRYVKNIPEIAHKLIERFWPGGLTLLFEAGPDICPMLTAGTGKIGIRLSCHPIATALAQSLGLPITGTSANISGRSACINAREVYLAFDKDVNLILDGGETQGDKGSTILDVTVDPPVILREGIIGNKQLGEII